MQRDGLKSVSKLIPGFSRRIVLLGASPGDLDGFDRHDVTAVPAGLGHFLGAEALLSAADLIVFLPHPRLFSLADDDNGDRLVRSLSELPRFNDAVKTGLAGSVHHAMEILRGQMQDDLLTLAAYRLNQVVAATIGTRERLVLTVLPSAGIQNDPFTKEVWTRWLGFDWILPCDRKCVLDRRHIETVSGDIIAHIMSRQLTDDRLNVTLSFPDIPGPDESPDEADVEDASGEPDDTPTSEDSDAIPPPDDPAPISSQWFPEYQAHSTAYTEEPLKIMGGFQIELLGPDHASKLRPKSIWIDAPLYCSSHGYSSVAVRVLFPRARLYLMPDQFDGRTLARQISHWHFTRGMGLGGHLTSEYLDTCQILEKAKQRVDVLCTGGNLMVGESLSLLRIYPDVLRAIERINDHVLIYGQVGVGKEVLFELLESANRRRSGFMICNLNGLGGNLVKSELYGHVKGAYTGADTDRAGAIETAGEGTLVLDNAQFLAKAVQVDLLRVLEGGNYRKFGSDDDRVARCRFIVAFNVEIKDLLAKDKLVPDLPRRFPIHIHLPSLNERRSDLPLLVDHFCRQYADEYRMAPALLPQLMPTSTQMEAWQKASWDGAAANIRGLRSAVRSHLDETSMRLSLGSQGKTASKGGRPRGRDMDDETLVAHLQNALDTPWPWERLKRAMKNADGEQVYGNQPSLARRISRIADATQRASALRIYKELARKYWPT